MYGAITHYGASFQWLPLFNRLSRTGSSHFARHYFGNLGWFLFLQLLRCFSSPRSLRIPMYSVCDDLKGRVSPFGNLRINVCLLTPRSLSQATTSFIACNRQGIHHVHLFTCPYNVSFWTRSRSKTGHRILLMSITLAFAVSKEYCRLHVFTCSRELFTYFLIWYNHTHPWWCLITDESLLLLNC